MKFNTQIIFGLLFTVIDDFHEKVRENNFFVMRESHGNNLNEIREEPDMLTDLDLDQNMLAYDIGLFRISEKMSFRLLMILLFNIRFAVFYETSFAVVDADSNTKHTLKLFKHTFIPCGMFSSTFSSSSLVGSIRLETVLNNSHERISLLICCIGVY